MTKVMRCKLCGETMSELETMQHSFSHDDEYYEEVEE